MPGYEPGRFHHVLASYLDRVATGQIKRLMVFAPPQHGKSEEVSRRFPAYMLGRDPDLSLLGCSYADSLAESMNLDVQSILSGDPYRECFPSTRLPSAGNRPRQGVTALRNSGEFDLLDGGGRVRGKYRSAGVGTGIVGRPARGLIIDDPIAKAEHAYSPAYRERAWHWYGSEAVTRLHPEGWVVLMHQRWHEDDLAGRLLKLAKDDPRADQWTVVRFPARAYPRSSPLRCSEDWRDEGEPLWPERYGPAFLDARQAGMSPQQWAAVYQQNPQPLEGAHFREAWFRRWDCHAEYWRAGSTRLISPKDCEILAVLDPAASEKQTADHSAVGIFALTKANDMLVLEMIRGRWGLEQIADQLLAVCQRWGVQRVLVEANGFQVAVVKECRRKPRMPPVAEVQPASRSKLVRATEAIARTAAGQVYLPETAPWVPAFVEECIRFTGREGDEDDQVDCFAYAARAQSARMDSGGQAFKPYTMGGRG